MTLILDAAPLVAAADTRDRMQTKVVELLESEPGPLVIPAPVSAEVDYLLATRLGEHARQAFLDDLAQGRFMVECLRQEEYPVVAQLERRYSELRAGLADLSVVVLAGRLDTRRIATFDERHFRVLRPLDGGSFKLLPGRGFTR
jgi:predicted nucleic acid-binding protein